MKKIICIFLFFSCLCILPLSGQSDTVVARYAVRDTQNVKVTLFDTDELFEISLRFDISQYKKKRSDIEYLDAVLTYHISKTDSINKNIKVRARGNIRRTDICDFPPLLLNFKLKDTRGGEFAGINKLKVVPYCRIGYEEYVLKEYLIYKLYNSMTENSLRVRLFKINYINTAKPGKPVKQYGFAIEPISLLEKRTNSMEVKSVRLTQKSIKPEYMDRFAIFNYMIGNTDWSVPIRHNALVMTQAGSDRPELGIIVPYDFDYSGLVNAEYAAPFEGLPIKSVQDRLYLGICRSEQSFRIDLKEFSDRKDEFYRIINEFPYLGAKSKKQMIMYLDGFFNGFDKRQTLLYKLINECRSF
jgi:hypothetical protein